MPKTVRFSRVVAACGRPRVHTLWVKPEVDGELKRARDTHRVMTLQRARGQTDAGTIGFETSPRHQEQYLIFPKSLRRFEGARVVGIKFDLIEQPAPAVDAHAWAAGLSRLSKRAASSAETESVIPFPVPDATPSPEPAPAGRAGPPSRAKRAPVSKRTREASKSSRARKEDTPLVREVRAALNELEQGKSVAAYRRLERALGAAR